MADLVLRNLQGVVLFCSRCAGLLDLLRGCHLRRELSFVEQSRLGCRLGNSSFFVDAHCFLGLREKLLRQLVDSCLSENWDVVINWLWLSDMEKWMCIFNSFCTDLMKLYFLVRWLFFYQIRRIYINFIFWRIMFLRWGRFRRFRLRGWLWFLLFLNMFDRWEERGWNYLFSSIRCQ